MDIPFDNSFARLPERFFAPATAAPAPAPQLLWLNEPLARTLGLDPDHLRSPAGLGLLTGTAPPPRAEPIAMAYAGHQFGGWSPRLGDGRAMLLGELVGTDGVRRDIHLKGSGRTAFSRAGDGLAAIGPVLREVIVSEAMHALGVPTTRSLAAVATGATVLRERALPGAVLVRVAESHVRFGTFQYFASRGDVDALRTLAGYVADRHDPAARTPLALLDGIVGKVAALVAHWQSIGFIHGVMNTDNMSVAGETIDYGPCAFMDTYHHATVYSSIDTQGRYAYANQPDIAHWNLFRFAEALLPLLDDDQDRAVAAAETVLATFPARFEAARLARFGAKLGLSEPRDGDAALIAALLDLMERHGLDFTNIFRDLAAPDEAAPSDLAAWRERWHHRLAAEPAGAPDRVMRAANPAVIPRNHRVEQALAAAESGDLTPLASLLEALRNPFEERPDLAAYRSPPRPDEIVRATFCGT